MNRTQAKTRFAQITQIRPYSQEVYQAARFQNEISCALHHVGSNAINYPVAANHAEFWILLVEYLESYTDISEDK